MQEDYTYVDKLLSLGDERTERGRSCRERTDVVESRWIA